MMLGCGLSHGLRKVQQETDTLAESGEEEKAALPGEALSA